MDDTSASRPDLAPRRRPPGCDQICLVLQGGGALGAYQGGVYQALHEAGLEPDFIASISIGAINAALIAGNERADRVERLRTFWETVTARPVGLCPPHGEAARTWYNEWSSWLTLTLGQPGFFTPNQPNPWFSPPGSRTALSFYDSTPLRETLSGLMNFDRLNHSGVRYAAGAVNLLNGNFAYFDSAGGQIGLDHVMASGALPPALPMVQIDTDYYWDGGLVSNTPLQHVLEHTDRRGLLIFQVDLFGARGVLPRDILGVLGRQKDIQYSSRTRMVTDMFRHRRAQDLLLKQAIAKVPEPALDDALRAERDRLSQLADVTLLHLIYQEAAYESQAKDYDFSAASMRTHWDAGYRDTLATLRNRDWLRVETGGGGLVVHDIHREDN